MTQVEPVPTPVPGMPPEAPPPPSKRAGLVRRLLPFVALIVVFGAAWATGLTDYLSLDALRENRARLESYRSMHPYLALLGYVVVYVLVVVFSLPGSLIMTLTGGMLFGAALGTAAAVTSASTGGTIVFLLARTSFGDALRARAGPAVGRLIDGFEQNAASYLLTLRFIPVIPFFIVNLAAGLVRMRLSTFVITTLVGILPASAVYASIGSSLVTVFARGGTPDLGVIFQPKVLAPLLGLAALSLSTVLFRAWRQRRAKAAV